MILGPNGLPIAGSANASVGGMMRGVGARNAAMFGGKFIPNEKAWIKGNGTGYFNPNFIRTENHIECKIRYSNENQSNYNAWFGSELVFNRFFIRVQDSYAVFYANGSGQSNLFLLDYVSHELKFENDVYYVDGRQIGSRQIITGTTPEVIMTTFYLTEIQLDRCSFNYLYYLKYFDGNGNLSRAFYPRVKDGIVGLYNPINDTFYPPIVGSFTYGVDE